MTENQSVIEEIAMVNCGRKILKFFLDRPLIFSLYGPPGLPGSVRQTNPDIYSSIHDPAIQSGRIPVKRLRIILRSGSVMHPLMQPFTHDSEFNDARRLTARSSPLTDRARYRSCEPSHSRLPSAPIAT
ncbi:hypothetical protein [Burkholderia ambifaria]|uniref:hypothetical protein n=1 Tax=Burkholderia ambifaria TaxID=152480 RepID=UPI0013E08882|nr:hypothetical protein [Burkholderia ambifaria]